MPGNAGRGSHSPELVDDIARNEVDVIVMETKVSVADAISAELVEFGLLHPLPALEGAELSPSSKRSEVKLT